MILTVASRRPPSAVDNVIDAVCIEVLFAFLLHSNTRHAIGAIDNLGVIERHGDTLAHHFGEEITRLAHCRH